MVDTHAKQSNYVPLVKLMVGFTFVIAGSASGALGCRKEHEGRALVGRASRRKRPLQTSIRPKPRMQTHSPSRAPSDPLHAPALSARARPRRIGLHPLRGQLSLALFESTVAREMRDLTPHAYERPCVKPQSDLQLRVERGC